MLESRLALWLGFWGLAIGTVILGAQAYANRREPSMVFHEVSFYICLWAAIMYMTMIQGLTVSYIDGKEFCWGRYVDWAVTTPLLLLQVGIVAGASRKLITKVIAVDLFMIITGFMASIGYGTRGDFGWFLVSCIAGFVILWVLVRTYGKFAPIQPTSDVRRLSCFLRLWMIISWFFYPIIWIISRIFDDPNPEICSNIFYPMADLYSKLMFGFFLNYKDQEVLNEAILRQRNRG